VNAVIKTTTYDIAGTTAVIACIPFTLARTPLWNSLFTR